MGRSTRKKQEEEAAKEAAVAERLSKYGNSGKTYRGIIDASILPKYVHRFRNRRLREYSNWTYRGKSKKIEKQRIELIRHAFAKYSVPSFLEDAFISEEKNTFNTYGKWYIAVAQGDSLYKTCTTGILTKKETHHFLQAPDKLAIAEAVWWARAVAISGDIGIAYRIARSPIGMLSYENEFNIDIHRFFTNNPVSMKEIEELLDYIHAMHTENADWTIKKRSLEAVRRQSEVWHRNMAKMRAIGGGSWEGMGVPPWKIVYGKSDPNPNKSTRTEWTIHEILTGNELAQEGNRMRHCVSGYKSRCMNGDTAIFSMRSHTMMKENQRHLTIQVTPERKSVNQVRGLANRMARPQEREIMGKWAHANGLLVHTRY